MAAMSLHYDAAQSTGHVGITKRAICDDALFGAKNSKEARQRRNLFSVLAEKGDNQITSKASSFSLITLLEE